MLGTGIITTYLVLRYVVGSGFPNIYPDRHSKRHRPDLCVIILLHEASDTGRPGNMRANAMKKPNLVVAAAASIALNLTMILATSSVDLGRQQLTPAGKLLVLLGQPGGLLAQWLFPGHDLITVLATFVCSLIFYAILILAVPCVFAYLRVVIKGTTSS